MEIARYLILKYMQDKSKSDRYINFFFKSKTPVSIYSKTKDNS